MRKIDTIDELRKIQMGILDAVHDFCLKEGIMYSLSSGTLIGAVRHKGYIPWDDDVDLYMLRPDYERFIATFNGRYPHYIVNTHKNNKDYHIAFAKVEDDRTVILDDVYNKMPPIGVNIDIFPIDGVPADIEARNRLVRKANILRFLLRAKNVKFTSQRKFRNNVAYALLKIAMLPVSKRRLIDMLEKCGSKGGEQSPQIYNFIAGYNNPDTCFPRECFRTTIDAPFEDRTYKIMEGYDAYLRHTYGDYMTLPPESERTVQHPSSAYYKD